MALNDKGAPGSQPESAPKALLGQANHTPSAKGRNSPPVKWKRVLAAFVSGRTLNRFEAEKSVDQGGLSDHCLHSTVSTIQAKGVAIQRRLESVPGFGGVPTECCRYWLTEDQRAKALALLNDEPKAEAAKDKEAAARLERAIRAEERERQERAQRRAA